GIALVGGGIWLVLLGGSLFYLIAGLVMLVVAGLLYRRREMALLLYAVFVIGALAWAVWEVGFDWWQLAPRGGIIVLLGLWLLTPWVRRPLASPGTGAMPTVALGVAMLLAVAVAAYSMLSDTIGIEGQLPEERVAEAGNNDPIPAGEWHQYGRTALGQRYSPLDQINV